MSHADRRITAFSAWSPAQPHQGPCLAALHQVEPVFLPTHGWGLITD